VSGGPLVATLVVLAVLTGLSWWLANVPLGALQTPVALAIAAAKASLVALVFMELTRASTAARVVAVVTISFIALLCLGVLADAGLR
jgi:cytochrome c oxidase subunit 4